MGEIEIAQERVVELLCDLVKIASPTGGEGEIADYIALAMRREGFDEVHVDENHNVAGVVTGMTPGRKLVLMTHSDSPGGRPDRVAVGELLPGGVFGTSGPVVAGPGAAAPKGSIAAMIAAGGALARARSKFHGKLMVAVVTRDLLANHDGPRQIAARHLQDADCGVIAEASGNDVVVGTRGILRLEVTIPGRTGHWSVPDRLGNAIYRLGDFLAELKALPVVEDARFGMTGCNPIDVDVCAVPPFLPSSAKVVVDRRLLPGETGDEFVALLGDIVARLKARVPGFDASVRVSGRMYPYEARGVDGELELLEEVVKRVTGRAPVRKAVKFGSNAGYLTSCLGVPALVLGPGNLAGGSAEEFVELREVVEAAHIYGEFALCYLGEARVGPASDRGTEPEG